MKIAPSTRWFLLLALPTTMMVAGCFGPSQANIQLRKENDGLRTAVGRLEDQQKADRARIAGLEHQATTMPVLPQDRLDRLFTVHGLQFSRLTGGYASTPGLAWDDLVKVYVVPVDADGQVIKAAGQFKVEIFDLADPQSPLLDSRQFSLDQSRSAWYGQSMLYSYVLSIPLTHLPQHTELTVVATFTDELTQRIISAEQKIKVRVATTSPASPSAPR
jgi:hypothetical protein